MNYKKKTEERGGCLNTGYHKRVHPFRNFLVVLPPPPYTKFKLGKKLWKHASNVVCGMRGGAGYVWIGKRPHDCSLPSSFSLRSVLCQESVNRNRDINKFSPGAPTPKRPKVGMNHGKRRARRREGAGDKAPECAIASGRWVGWQTRCLVSVLTKRGINSMKQANLY